MTLANRIGILYSLVSVLPTLIMLIGRISNLIMLIGRISNLKITLRTRTKVLIGIKMMTPMDKEIQEKRTSLMR